MKNYEKYADEIREYIGEHFCKDFIAPYILKSNKCNLDDCGLCNMLQNIWLLEDYKEPETDWSKVEVDTPILVTYNEKGEWLRRHFAKQENGLVYAWKDAFTSWTVLHDEDVVAWKFAKLAESEDE